MLHEADQMTRNTFFPPFMVEGLGTSTSRPQTTSGPAGTGPVDSTTHAAEERPDPQQAINRLLPATWRNEDDNIQTPEPDCLWFLTKELCVPRLNAIHDSMWVVGRPMPPRSLTAQLVHRRELVVTEDMNLHLVWAKGTMFLKPVPRFLLVPAFWRDHLAPDEGNAVNLRWVPLRDEDGRVKAPASKAELAPCAAGFLFSWTALISHESDFKIAHDKGLVPAEVSWFQWKALTEDFLRHPAKDIYDNLNVRFHYGELRLSRLNKIYRWKKLHARGYWFGYSQSADFFEDNFTKLASILGYVVIVLTAMQVGLGTTRLQESQRFQDASYGFTVFSIVAPLIAVALVLAVFFILVLWNVTVTKKYAKTRFGIMGVKSEDSSKTQQSASLENGGNEEV